MLYLDSALRLTHGNPFRLAGLLTRLRPTNEFFTAVAPAANGFGPLIGQVFYHGGEKSAHISYLLPLDGISSPALPALLEALAWQAGDRGAFHLLAEVEERSPAFEGLRAAGFSTYARQRVWRMDALPAALPEADQWRQSVSVDEHAIRNLYHSITPPLVQAAEPFHLHLSHGLSYFHDGELVAFVDVAAGPRGVYVHPLIHPDVAETPALLASLMARLHPAPNRPVYLAVRSYEAWLEPPMEDLGANVGPRQAVLVRHLASAIRDLQALPHLSVLERRIEPGAPIAQNIQSSHSGQPPTAYKIQEP